MEQAVTVWASVLFVTRAAARAAVVTRLASLRAGPSSSWPIKETLQPGDELLLVAAERDGYYEVRITDLARWSEDRDAPLVAYVVDVTQGSLETPRRAPWRVCIAQHDVDPT